MGEGEKAEIVSQMKQISATIAEGAMSFLFTEYLYMGVYVVVFSGILLFFTGKEATISFVVGALTSIICGWIGMKIAVYTNVRTTHECWAELSKGFDVAIQGGCVMGFSLVSLGIINLFILIQFLLKYSSLRDQQLYEAVAGYGLGGSSIALFGRVGGGIYTKAADVGADLSGKNDYGMDADLFGSFAESTCAALVLAASSIDLREHGWCAIMYPVLISSLGVVVGIVTLLVYGIVYPINNQDPNTVEKALKGILNISTLLMTPVVYYLSKVCLPETFKMDKEGPEVQWWYCCLSISLGLWSGLLIGYVTEYYTP